MILPTKRNPKSKNQTPCFLTKTSKQSVWKEDDYQFSHFLFTSFCQYHSFRIKLGKLAIRIVLDLKKTRKNKNLDNSVKTPGSLSDFVDLVKNLIATH